MKHFGDITKLNGAELPVVDIITGGSPCQDLSVAGKRAGLAGERSGLFMDQIRIIKEMRAHGRRTGRPDGSLRPRYMVWENVPGAFSSNKGRDFAAVLEETIRIVEPEAPDVPVPPNGWPTAGCLYDELGGWSVAWRVHDAQFWGVPQRRRRISLVADFGGLTAPEILFEREGLSGDFEPGGEEGQGAAAGAEGGVEGAIGFHLTQDPVTRVEKTPCLSSGNPVNGQAPVGVLYTLNNRSVLQVGCDVYNQEVTGDVAASLTAASGGTNTSGPKVLSCGFKPREGAQARSHGFAREISPTLDADGNSAVLCRNDQGGSVMGVSEGVTGALRAEEHGHPPSVVTYDARGNGDGKTVCTITGDHQNRVTDYTALCVGNGQLNQMSMAEQANTLDTMHDQQAVLIASVYGVSSFGAYKEGTTSLRAQGGDNGGGSENIAVQNAIVRRLTPLECERLQGYPDKYTDLGEWTDSKGKKHKDADSPRYKALGNSIALPFWQWMFGRMREQYPEEQRDSLTMGSLFDGIGGFPLTAQRNGIRPVWASEIEEFPIAVTKKHFPEEGEDGEPV